MKIDSCPELRRKLTRQTEVVELGIFTQQDPVQGIVGGSTSMYWNPYGYAGGNPTNYTDPSGQIVCGPFCVIGIAAIVGLLSYSDTRSDFNDLQRQHWGASTGLAVVCEPCDWGMTFSKWADGDFHPADLLGLLPFIPAGWRAFADGAGDVPFADDIGNIRFAADGAGVGSGVAPRRRVLVLGEEQDFRYARQLAEAHEDWIVYATRYEPGNNAQRIIGGEGNLTLVEGVDGRRLGEGAITGKLKFNDIVFNGPHAPGEGHPYRRAGELVEGVLRSAPDVLAPNGYVRFSSGGGMPSRIRLDDLFRPNARWWKNNPPYPHRYGPISNDIPFLDDLVDGRLQFGLPDYTPLQTGGRSLGVALEDMRWYIFQPG